MFYWTKNCEFALDIVHFSYNSKNILLVGWIGNRKPNGHQTSLKQSTINDLVLNQLLHTLTGIRIHSLTYKLLEIRFTSGIFF